MTDEDKVKDLQRELQKRTDSNKTTLRALIDSRTDKSRISKLTKVMETIAAKLGDYDTDFADLAETIKDTDADTVRTGEQLKAIDTVLAGDKELNDEVFQKAVDLLQAGKLEEAATLVQGDAGVSADDFEDAVEKQVQAVLASKFKIDAGEAVATPKKDFDFNEWRKLSPEKRLEMPVEELIKNLEG